MTVKYVVSIAGELLYFDDKRQPATPIRPEPGVVVRKPDLKLLPNSQRIAASQEWDGALGSYSAEQRQAAEISEVV